MRYRLLPLLLLLASCAGTREFGNRFADEAAKNPDFFPELIVEVATGNWFAAGAKILGLGAAGCGAIWGGKKLHKKHKAKKAAKAALKLAATAAEALAQPASVTVTEFPPAPVKSAS
jgi:hypothetical protein